MTTFDEATLIDDWAAAWSSSDADKVVALFTDDCVYEDVTMGIVNQGKEELKSFAKTFSGAFSNMKFELQTRFVSGTLGSAEWTASGTHTGDAPGLPATNKYVSLRGASVTARGQDQALLRLLGHGHVAQTDRSDAFRVGALV